MVGRRASLARRAYFRVETWEVGGGGVSGCCRCPGKLRREGAAGWETRTAFFLFFLLLRVRGAEVGALTPWIGRRRLPKAGALLCGSEPR